MIEKLGSAVPGYDEGQRVIAGAITPSSGRTPACVGAVRRTERARSMAGSRWVAGGSATPSTAAQAEYLLVPDAMANLAPVPDGSERRAGADVPRHHVDRLRRRRKWQESGIGDTVAVFAQGPIGLCATAGARLMGATTIIGVDRVPERLEMARRMGARPCRRLLEGRSGRRDHADHRRSRRRCRDRGAGTAGHLRGGAAGAAAGRHAVERSASIPAI